MDRRRRLRFAAWLTTAFLGCAAPAAQPLKPPPPAPEVAPAPPPSSADPVYEAITTERQRHGLEAELDPLLGKNVSQASSVSPVFKGEPRPTVDDGRGGSLRFWHSDGLPWILHVDANGTVSGYDVPTKGVAGRRTPPAPAPRGSQQSVVKGLDDMVGLPIDSLIAEDFTPVDRAKLGDGSRIYTFRTPDLYFLCLSTDEKGAITGWGSTLPGLERPLRSPPKSPK